MADSSFDLNLKPEDSPARKRRKKRLLTEEDVHYMQKIEQLANERLNFFRNQELEETNNNSTAVSKLKSHPRPTPVQKIRRKVPKKTVRTPPMINKTTDRLKEFIVNEMKGTDLKLVIQKNLYKSDTEKGLNRLNMPVNQLVNDDFLTVDESRFLNGKNHKENGIEVGLLGPTLEMYKEPMKLKMWHMSSTVNYVLMTHWYAFWFANKECLKEGTKIQVWSFRREERLCFAVVCVEEPDGQIW